MSTANETRSTTPRQLCGADLLVESLIRNGVEVVFAYPGGLLERATIGELSVTQLDGEVRRLLRASRRKAAMSR